MSAAVVQVRNERLRLLPEKVIHWPAMRMLIIADLHLGKAMHFRRAGIAVPATVEHQNLQRLEQLIIGTRPSEVLFLGDLFHSGINRSWQEFMALRIRHTTTRFTLVTGNHDVLEPVHYAEAGLGTVAFLDRGPFHFTHHPTEHASRYNLAGHVHPGIRMIGKGRQVLQLPCFFFGRNGAVLPAFGGFTGLHGMVRKRTDRVFIAMEGNVLRV